MRTPWTIDRMLFRDALFISLLAIVGLTALFIVILMMQVMQKVEGVSVSSLMRFVPPLASGYQSYLIPVAVCAGSAMTYGRFSAEREALAAMSGGIKPSRLLSPAFCLGLLLCVPAYFAAFHWAPEAYNNRDRIKQEAIADILDNPPIGGRSLTFPNLGLSYRDQRRGVFDGLVLHTMEDGEIRSTLSTNRAELAFERATGKLSMFGAKDAVLLTSNAEGDVQGQPARFTVQMLELPIPKPAEKARASFKGDTPEELMHYMGLELDEGVFNKRGVREYPTVGEFIKRVLFTFAPLFFALVGALVGLLVRSRNRVVPLGTALILGGGVFFSLVTISNRVAVEGLLSESGRFADHPIARLLQEQGLLGAVLPGLIVGLLPLLLVLGFLRWRLHRPAGGVRVPALSWLLERRFSRRKVNNTSNTFPVVDDPEEDQAPIEKPRKPRRAITLSPLAWVLALIPGMRRYDRYFFHAVLGSTIMAIVAISLLFVAIDFLTNLESLSHQPPRAIVEHYAILLPPILYMLAPLMLLLGSSFALVRILKHRELLALQVAGVRTSRALRTFWLTALVMTGAMFALHETVLPKVQARAEANQSVAFADEKGEGMALFDEIGAHWRIGSYNFIGKEPLLSGVEVLRFDRFGGLKERLYTQHAIFREGAWWAHPKRFSLASLGLPARERDAPLPLAEPNVAADADGLPERGESDQPPSATLPATALPEGVGVKLDPLVLDPAKPLPSTQALKARGWSMLTGVSLPPVRLLKEQSEQEFKTIPTLFERAQASDRPGRTLALYRALTYPFYCISLLMLGVVLALRYNARSAFVAGAMTLALALGTYAATFLAESLAVKEVMSPETAAFAPALLLLVVGWLFSTVFADHIARR